ncbi:MAG: MFS transporter [Phototrophicales bacterium]|nr:MFS transporter [Phototrophicales bacterium]
MTTHSDIPHKKPFRLTRNVWVTTITSFLTDVSSEMINNLLPLFLANVLGVSTAVIGLIEGIAEMTSSFLKAFSGWLSDKIGNRKWLAVAGYAISACAKPFFYFVTTWGGVLAIRFADRTGKGIRNSPRDALIADSTDEQHRGIAFGVHRAGDTAGAVLGIGIALLVVLATQAGSLTLSRDTFQILVLIGIIPAFLAVIALATLAKEAPRKKTSIQPMRLNWGALSPDFKFFLLIVGIFTLGNSSDAFIILRAQERGLTIADILGMLLMFNLIYAVFSSPLGALSDKIGRKRILIGGWLVYGVLYLCFALATDGMQIWLIYALYGLYYAAAEGTAKAMIADLIPSEQRGTAYGYYNALVGFMAFPASLLAGVLWQGVGSWTGFGASAPFLFGAMLALIAAGLLIVFGRKRGVAVAD